VYEQDNGGYPAIDKEKELRRRKFELIIGLGLLICGFIGAALAQTININTNDRVEFGQGIVTLKACDSFISISLNPSAATFSGNNAAGAPYENASRVRSILMTGLDTRACAGRTIKLQLFAGESTTAMYLFSESQTATSVNSAFLVIDANKTLDRALSITLLNSQGQNIERSSADQSLVYSTNDATYTLEFSAPLALMSDVSRVSVETSIS
jgi:type 1 fimbria pilin